MNTDELDSLIEEPFNAPDLATLWDDILARYKQMGFAFPLTDAEQGRPLTDNEMVSEFGWVHQQYRKYIGKKRTELLELKGDLASMLITIQDMIDKDNIVPDNRRTLVYQSMKHQWLLDTWNHIAWIIEQLNDNGEENNG